MSATSSTVNRLTGLWRRAARPLRALVSGLALLALAVALARLPLTWAVAGVIGVAGALVVLIRPSLGLIVLAFTVPFGSLRQFSVAGLSVGASEVLVAGMLIAWTLRLAILRQGRVTWTGLATAIAAYLAILCLSLLSAVALVPALKELAKWTELLVIYLLVASEMSESDARMTLAALLTAGTLEGLLGIYQFVGRVGPPGFALMGRYMRAHGTFDQPNPYGGYLGLLLPLSYGLVLTGWRGAWERAREREYRHLALWGLAVVALVVMLTALIMSWSRGALVGFVAGVALVIVAQGRRMWVMAVLVGLALVLVGQDLPAFLPDDLLGRATSIVDYLDIESLRSVEITDENFAMVERVAHWVAALRMFDRSPWLGVGTGQYATVYPEVALPRWQAPLGHAHNYYLNVLAESGMVGLASYLAMLGAALWAVCRALRKAMGWRRGMVLGALGMLGHLMVHSVVDNLYVHDMYLVVGIMLGMVAWASRSVQGSSARPSVEKV